MTSYAGAELMLQRLRDVDARAGAAGQWRRQPLKECAATHCSRKHGAETGRRARPCTALDARRGGRAERRMA